MANNLLQTDASLHGNERLEVLDTVDNLRSLGVAHSIDLPQIIVCGDQSCGKSSVLEAISGINFPRKDNLCTRFATEVILRRSQSTKLSVSIAPDGTRPEAEQAALRAFSETQNADTTFDLTESIEAATAAMGIDQATRRFGNDTLRIEISGPDQPHLTLVDLPGLFRAGTRAQSDEDAKLVNSLVQFYMAKKRSIILAVVSAANDLANQIVTKYARQKDSGGQRTLGIITKPDSLPVGSDSERNFFELAENKDIRFRHGWHVVRNRDYHSRNDDMETRNRVESDFFSSGIWSSLPTVQTGVTALKVRLSSLLERQIMTELPSLLNEIQTRLQQSQKAVLQCGSPRSGPQEQRIFTLSISQRFTTLLKAAVDGNYDDAFFGDPYTGPGLDKRLRAVVQNTLTEFSQIMRKDGHARHIVEKAVTKKDLLANPCAISRDDYILSIMEVMRRSRGRELPGTYNPEIIGELFRAQCQPWKSIIMHQVEKIWDAVQRTLHLIVAECADPTTATKLWRHHLAPKLPILKENVQKEVLVVMEPHQYGHPITYNHYFTEELQKVKEKHRRAYNQQKLDGFFGTDLRTGKCMSKEGPFNISHLLDALTSTNTADMDKYACSELADCVRAY